MKIVGTDQELPPHSSGPPKTVELASIEGRDQHNYYVRRRQQTKSRPVKEES